MAEDTVIIRPRSATGDTKFDLMMRTRELHELESLLKTIHDFTPSDRKSWVEDNGSMLSQAFDQFISDTSQTLESISMDDEILALSKELVTTLRDTSELLDGLVATKSRLSS